MPSEAPPILTLEQAEKLIMHDRQITQYWLQEERRREQRDTQRVSGNPGAWHENLVTAVKYSCWIINPKKPTGVCGHRHLANAIVQAYELAGYKPPVEIARVARWHDDNPTIDRSPFPPPAEKKKK